MDFRVKNWTKKKSMEKFILIIIRVRFHFHDIKRKLSEKYIGLSRKQKKCYEAKTNNKKKYVYHFLNMNSTNTTLSPEIFIFTAVSYIIQHYLEGFSAKKKLSAIKNHRRPQLRLVRPSRAPALAITVSVAAN